MMTVIDESHIGLYAQWFLTAVWSTRSSTTARQVFLHSTHAFVPASDLSSKQIASSSNQQRLRRVLHDIWEHHSRYDHRKWIAAEDASRWYFKKINIINRVSLQEGRQLSDTMGNTFCDSNGVLDN